MHALLQFYGKETVRLLLLGTIAWLVVMKRKDWFRPNKISEFVNSQIISASSANEEGDSKLMFLEHRQMQKIYLVEIILSVS